MKINDIAITSLETITAFDVVTGNYLFTLDELSKTSIEQSQESTEITGKQGRKLTSLKRSKTVKISGENGMVSSGLLEMQTGGSFESKNTTVMWTDYLTVTSNTAVTTYKAVGTTGAEIEGLYVKNADGTLGNAFTQDSSVGSGKFTYSPETKTLAFNAGEIADGAEIVVYYKRVINASVLKNESDKYSGKATLYIDAMGEDKCANVYRIQFYIPKADFSGQFSFEMGDNQTVHSFEAEALAGACGAGASLWTYTVFGAETADASTANAS